MKKTGILPKGKLDMRFILPVIKEVHVGDEKFGKLEYFFGYKVYDVKKETNLSYIYDYRVLVKILTGEQKGYLFKTKESRRKEWSSFHHIEFAGVDIPFDFKVENGIYFIDSLKPTWECKNREQLEKLLNNLPKTATWQELSDMVAAQNIELEEMMRGARMELAAKVAKRQKIEKENNKIFE